MHRGGLPGIHVAYLLGGAAYHTDRDTLAAIRPGVLQVWKSEEYLLLGRPLEPGFVPPSVCCLPNRKGHTGSDQAWRAAGGLQVWLIVLKTRYYGPSSVPAGRSCPPHRQGHTGRNKAWRAAGGLQR
jgi:hypothetical protein